MPDFQLESGFSGLVAGVDEVGRGPLAGPVVAAAVILDQEKTDSELLAALDDSKKLTAKKRDVLFELIMQDALVGVGAASVREIDQINILQATFVAMRRAVGRLAQSPDHVLVDGNKDPGLGLPVTTVVKGDGKSVSIAAASIVAKVIRDRGMEKLARRYPAFGWESNAGYGVKKHKEALARIGPTSHHRHSFAPVAQASLAF